MLTIEIKNTGSAFEFPEQEIARILRQLAYRIEEEEFPTTIRDINGNTCGTVVFNPDQK